MNISKRRKGLRGQKAVEKIKQKEKEKEKIKQNVKQNVKHLLFRTCVTFFILSLSIKRLLAFKTGVLFCKLVTLVTRLVFPLPVKELFAARAHVLFRLLVAIITFFKRWLHDISTITLRVALETNFIISLIEKRFVTLGTNRFRIHGYSFFIRW